MKYCRNTRSTTTVLLAALGVVLASQCAAQSAWKPDRTVEFIVGSTAGGGNDRTARSLQKIWQNNKWLENTVVVNKVGGGGAIAYAHTSQHPGDGHYVAVARMALLTNHILGRSPVKYTDLTPLALLGNEPTAFAVRGDSPLKTIKDLVARWQADPQSLSISVGSTRGSTTHFVLALVAKAAGVDPRKLKVITFGGGAESVTHLLGGHIDMMSQSIDNAIAHHKAGTMRIIGISTAKRSAGLPDVPTLKEQGYDVVLGGWTAIVGPPGLASPQVAYWEHLLERTAHQVEWRRQLDADALEWEFMKSQPTRDYLRQQYDLARGLLVELGMAK